MTRPFHLLTDARTALVGFSAIGVGWGSFAASVPDLKAQAGLTEAELGLALFIGAAGGLVAMAGAPRLMTRIGDGAPATTLLSLLVALTFVAIGQAEGWWTLALAICLGGATTGALDVLANARVSRLEHVTGRHLMSLHHGTFSLAYASAALLSGIARQLGLPPAVIFAGTGLAVLALALIAWRAPRQTLGPPSQPRTSDGHRTPLPPAIFWAGLLILIAFFSENATEVWSALHIELTLGGAPAQGALGPTVLGLTMAAGRFAGQGLTQRFGERALLKGSVYLASIGAALAALAPSPLVAYLGFAGLGLGTAMLAPLVFALGGKHLAPDATARGISAMSVMGYSGMVLGPPMLGYVAEAYGLRAAFAVVAAVLLLFPPLLARLTPPAASPGSPPPQPAQRS